MNVIPKLLQGGISSLFTEYQQTPYQRLQSLPVRETSSTKRRSRSDDDDDDTGELTQKDLMKMIKDIDGLPNDMQSIIYNLSNTLKYSNITGSSVNDLATTYLSSLLQMKIANQNKTNFDNAIKNALANGAMSEPAISPNGEIFVLTSDGSIHEMSLDDYINSGSEGSPLSVSNIAYLRKYDSSFKFNDGLINVINNSIGFEGFLKLLSSAIASLGSTEYNNSSQFSVEGLAIKGLELIKKLSQDDLVQALGSVTAEGLYGYKVIDKNLLSQIKILTKYLSTIFPKSAKVWAAFKLQTSDEDKAIESLIFNYLLSGQETSHTFNITDYKDTSKGNRGSRSNSGDSDQDPIVGEWKQMQAGQGGEDSDLYYKKGSSNAMITGAKFYSAPPGLEEDCSLTKYLTNMGNMVKSRQNITFGDIPISPDSFDDVLVDAQGGGYVVTIPTKPDGRPWLEILDVFELFKKELSKNKLKPGSAEYIKKAQDLLKEDRFVSLAGIINSNGELNPRNSGHFLVLNGIASEKTMLIDRDGVLGDPTAEHSFGDVNSEYIIQTNDDRAYDKMIKGLSDKENDYEYDLDSGLFGEYDLYKGNIYIQLSSNPINAMNADDNNIKESKSYDYEEDSQQFYKINNNNPDVSSDNLWN